MTNLIEERNERTKERKKRKKQMDRLITLSHDEEQNVLHLSSKMKLADTSIRLLDEGFCDNGFVLKKGTIEKYLNGQNEVLQNLTDDFVGNVNLGHMDFATFPYVIGEWNKNDLTLVDIENDRKALDISVRLDEESVFVKELARQPYDIGVSAEFYYNINDEDTEELSQMMGTYLPVIDEIFIFAYGLVGECGNVNSSGLELKGEAMSQVKKELMAEEEVKVEVEVTDTEEVIEEIEQIEEVVEEATEEVTEEATEEVAELGVEEIDITINEEESAEEETESDGVPEEAEEVEEEESDDAESEEDVDEEVSDDADDEVEVEEADLSFEGILEEIINLRKENAELKEHIKALKKNNKRLDKKLKSEYTAKAEFLAKTANLTAELFPNEGEVERQEEEEAKKLAEVRRYYKGDGIAD